MLLLHFFCTHICTNINRVGLNLHDADADAVADADDDADADASDASASDADADAATADAAVALFRTHVRTIINTVGLDLHLLLRRIFLLMALLQ